MLMNTDSPITSSKLGSKLEIILSASVVNFIEDSAVYESL